MMILRGCGFDQAEIADKLGVSQQTVSRYMRTIKSIAEKCRKAGKKNEYEVLYEILFGDNVRAYLKMVFGLG